MKLLEFINKKSNNAYENFKLVSVIFDEKKLECVFKFLYKDELHDDAKENLAKLIKDYINEDISVVVKCRKSYIDSDLVRDVIYNFVTRNFSSIGIDFKKENIIVKLNDNEINVDFICTAFQNEHIINNLIDKEIISYANTFFFENFVLNIIVEENKNETEDFIPTIDIDLSDNLDKEFKYYKVDNIQPLIGEISGNPIQISCIKSSLDNLEITGNIRFLTQKSFESKRKDKEGNTVVKNYYSFTLFDKSGKINCVYFPNKSDLLKAEELTENQQIIVHGDVEEFNEKLNFKVKSIAFCNVIEEEEIQENIDIHRVPNDKYFYVQPEPHIDIVQDNLFAEKIDVGQYLMNNDVVVFDIETTGLDASKCEIIEIGAVKISHGRIIETFETLIKPNSTIPEEITNLTGITDDMVSKSPSIKQVMPDFYKFCYGSTIMAYNIDFDYKFISLFGQKLGYIFDNPQIDVLFLARSFIVGLKNFKLSTVCKKLEISLENAHRAVHDALATAEVVLKLGPNIT